MTPSLSNIGAYHVLQLIGRGGMGAVYKVEREGQFYALKTILPEYVGENSLARFEREALTAATVDRHPNIVSIHKLELNSQPPFIVMSYIEGKGLDQLIEEGKSWTPEQVLGLLAPIASALDHMHSKGVIHRDLKPANILVRDHDNAPLITDFGLAKESNLQTLTQAGEVVGTPNYMAPEQLYGQPVSPQTDIWALGVIVYNLLSGGKSPFHGENLVQLANAILRTEPKLEALAPRSNHLITALEKALNKSDQQRFSNCQEFLTALNTPEPQPQRDRSLAIVILVVLLLMSSLTLAAILQRESDEPSQKTNWESLRSSLDSLKADLGGAQEQFPQHYFAHLDAQFPGAPPLSRKVMKECVKFNSLQKRVGQFEQQFNDLEIKNRKLRKQLKRWKELSASYGVLENSLEGNKNDQANTELELGKFLEAYYELEGNPERSEQILQYKPENISWRPAWILMRAICAKKRKKNSRAVKYLSLLQKEYPTLFHNGHLRALWQSKIRIIETQGKIGPQGQFKIIFYLWRIKQVETAFKIPTAYQEAFTSEGQLNFPFLYLKLSNLIGKGPIPTFDITLDAADHGIYLDQLDNSQSRQRLHTQKIAAQNLRKRPQHGPSLFWNAYVQRPYSILNGQTVPLPAILKDIESALKLTTAPFQRAQLLGQRVSVLLEDRRNNSHKYDINEFSKNCLSDISEAYKLFHPRPHRLIRLKFEVMIQLYEANNQLGDKKSELFGLLDQYLALCKKNYNLSAQEEGQALATGRPPGVPYGRFNDNSLRVYEAEVAQKKAEFFIKIKDWISAERPNYQALEILRNYSTARVRLDILKNLKRVDKIIELRLTLIKYSQANPTKRRIFKKFIEEIEGVIQTKRQK